MGLCYDYCDCVGGYFFDVIVWCVGDGDVLSCGGCYVDYVVFDVDVVDDV